MLPRKPPLHLIGELRSGRFFLELHVDGGGVWELDPTGPATRLVGQRVEVIGTQIGFSDLRCDEIWPAGTPRPHGPLVALKRHTLWLWVLAGLIVFALLGFV